MGTVIGPAPDPGDVVSEVNAFPVHQDVFFRAPSQLKLKWMWSVCGLAPLYARHPLSMLYAPQIWRFQMMYMMPKRRAIAPGRPWLSGATSQATTEFATARSWGLLMSSIQSSARPSECSVRPELQFRLMP